MSIKKTISLIFLFIYSLTTQSISAQNFKKIFKKIENDKIYDALVEFQKINDYKEYSELDSIKIYLATALILNSKHTEQYDCYKALDVYVAITNLKKNETEINNFLKKYDLNIKSIKDKIYANILTDAKELNTETSYKRAIALCDSCYYLKEAKLLKASAAFRETQQKNDIESYTYFITNYKDSDYYKEAYYKLVELEFYRAKSSNSIEALNSFIEKYESKNEYVLDAISIKDSVVYFRTPKKYKDYNLFIQSNKASKFYSIAKNQLPNILFDEAKKEQSITLFDQFLNEFPKDERTIQIKSDLIPNLLFEQGTKNKNTDYLERFIQEYPEDTERIDLAKNNLETIYSQQAENEISFRESLNLFGNVKSFRQTEFIAKESFGEIEFGKFYENAFYYEFSESGKSVKIFFFSGIAYRPERTIEYFYDSKDDLVEEKFGTRKTEMKYDNRYNLIEIKTFDKFYSDEYKLIGKLIYKFNDENKINEEYHEPYKEGKYGYPKDDVDFRLKYTYDIRNNLIEKSGSLSDYSATVRFIYKYDDRNNKTEEIEYLDNKIINKFIYKYNQNNNLVEKIEKIVNSEIENLKKVFKYDSNNNEIEEKIYFSDESNHVDMMYTHKYDSRNNLTEEATYFLDPTNDYEKHIYEYDTRNNIIEEFYDWGEGTRTTKFKYEFDNRNNWVKKIEYNDSNKEFEEFTPITITIREIEYYDN